MLSICKPIRNDVFVGGYDFDFFQFFFGSLIELVIQIVAVAATGLGKAGKKIAEKAERASVFLFGKGFQVLMELSQIACKGIRKKAHCVFLRVKILGL